MEVKQQKGTVWIDESGNNIPGNRITELEKFREKKAFQLAAEAQKLSHKLAEFKALIADVCEQVLEKIRKEEKLKSDHKGNYTWFNFDRSIKIEVSINEAIAFDDVLIGGAKTKLLELIDNSISGDDFIKQIIMEAFQTTKGKLDTSRVLGLRGHSSRIKNAEIKAQWQEAMDLIDRSISRPQSKTYYRVWVRQDNGEYKSIDLNFSSVA
jgi:Txe/YoeB family toxin of Txe-Axe toxin-antitoxin module